MKFQDISRRYRTYSATNPPLLELCILRTDSPLFDERRTSGKTLKAQFDCCEQFPCCKTPIRMAYMNEEGLLLDNLMHVSKPIKNAVVLNKVLVKQRDKVVKSLEKERALKMRQFTQHQHQLSLNMKEKQFLYAQCGRPESSTTTDT